VSPVQAQAETPAMAGTYVIDRARSDDINQAIETAVSRLSIVNRPRVRGWLRRTNLAYQRIVIGLGGGSVSLGFDQRGAIVTPANGTPVNWTREDGERLKVSAQWENGRLEQTFRGEDERRVNVFSLSADGRMLTLDVTVTSPLLARPMIYKLVYARAG
jgi:hypothetical protein